MKTLGNAQMENLSAGKPDWGDFASGLCLGLGVTLAAGTLGGFSIKYLAPSIGLACGIGKMSQVL